MKTAPLKPAVIAALIVTLTLLHFTDAQEKNLPLTVRAPEPSPFAAPGVTLTDVTKAAGLGGFRHVSGSPGKDYIIEATGSGCAFIDYDNDGWLDIYLVNGGTMDVLRGREKAPHAALFHNNKDGTFTDVTEQAGVASERFGQGVCAGDFDNDGWTDLYVTNYGKNRLYRNNGNGTFTDVAERAGVAAGAWSTGCAFGDYDGDGLLDLFVAGYIELDLNRLPPPGTGSLASEAQKKDESQNTGGMGASYRAGMSACQYRSQRVMCGPRGLKGAPDHLFRNNGDGTFTETSARAGVADKAGYYGFGVAWFDLDDDGRLDLIVANDSTPNYVYRNRGDGTFEDVSYASGAALNEHGREQAHMGVAIGDYDGDGRADIHITNFSDDSNVLYHNDGGGNFTDVTFPAGLGEVTIPFLGWGTNFFDYDNDGALDLLAANGHVYPLADTADWGTSYRQRLLLFRNVKNRFREAGSGAGAALNVPRPARGSAVGDFDNDGDPDILLNNIDEAPTLLRNDGGHKSGHWLTVRLIGNPKQKCPRDAIGSVVFCTANGRRMRGEVASGRSYNSQSDLRVHFGFGAAAKVDRLEVRWAGGRTELFEITRTDQFLTLEQGKGIARP
ncbi:MAG TPA: CRTAC1 family protein [Blastocatellia bacterium]|nr:CRTAC1 family protein [Blastocatellia bacterium]